MGDREATIEAVLARISARAKHRIELRDLVDRWNLFVSEVQRGYTASIYDYTNDLSIRDLLDEVISSLSPEQSRSIEDSITGSDDAYRNATTPSSKPLLPLPPRVQSWWWFRLPNRITGELRDDLIAEGFIGDSRG